MFSSVWYLILMLSKPIETRTQNIIRLWGFTLQCGPIFFQMALLKTCLHHVLPWEAKSAGVHLSDISRVHSSWRSRYFWPWSFIYKLVSVVYCNSGQSAFGEQCKTAFEKQTCMYMDVYICTHWPSPAFRGSSLISDFYIWFRRPEPGSPVLWF